MDIPARPHAGVLPDRARHPTRVPRSHWRQSQDHRVQNHVRVWRTADPDYSPFRMCGERVMSAAPTIMSASAWLEGWLQTASHGDRVSHAEASAWFSRWPGVFSELQAKYF